MKILDIPQSGKIGTMVSYKRPSGQVRRQYVVPHDPKTGPQMERRMAMKQARLLWGTLTDRQQAAWNSTAHNSRTRRSLNQSASLSGYLLFVRIYCNLAAIGLPPVLEPPPQPRFDLNPVEELTITSPNGTLTLQLSVTGQPAGYIIVSGTKPRSTGTTYVDHFTILGVLPDPVGGVSGITELYTAKYGQPPSGSRVFIEVVQQIDGWRSLPQRFSARVG
jgi:hypothetical protein